MFMDKAKYFGSHAYKSLAVSNAIELFKLIFFSTAKAPDVPSFLAETLRRYSEHDLFTAFNYLRDKNFMVTRLLFILCTKLHFNRCGLNGEVTTY